MNQAANTFEVNITVKNSENLCVVIKVAVPMALVNKRLGGGCYDMSVKSAKNEAVIEFCEEEGFVLVAFSIIEPAKKVSKYRSAAQIAFLDRKLGRAI